MIAQVALLSFADLLRVAEFTAPAGEGYEKQRELIGLCRLEKRAFLAIMPVRSRFKCSICGVERGDAELHFEDPSQPLTPSDSDAQSMWGNAVGRFVDIDLSTLHGILMHESVMPSKLKELFSSRQGAG